MQQISGERLQDHWSSGFLSHYNAYVRKFTIKAIRFFASFDIYLVFGPHI